MPLGFSTKSIDFSNPYGATLGIGLNIGSALRKGQLVNLDEDEVFKFLFNPTEVKKTKSVNFKQQKVAFRSHPKYQYESSGPTIWTMELYLHSASSGSQSIINVLPLSRNIAEDANFLDSLLYPVEGIGLKDRRPPRVRFVWPELANIPVVVTDVSPLYKKFNIRLQQMMTMVAITFHEDPENNITSNMVRDNGATSLPGILGAVLDNIPGASSVASAIAGII